MTSTKSCVSAHIDRSLGYLGLFLIGLIGWFYDRLAPAATGNDEGRQVTVEHSTPTGGVYKASRSAR